MRPLVRSYGEISQVTLSPTRILIKFLRILPDTCARITCEAGSARTVRAVHWAHSLCVLAGRGHGEERGWGAARLVGVVQLHAEVRIRERLEHHALQLEHVLLLLHSDPRHAVGVKQRRVRRRGGGGALPASCGGTQ
jgi:hypothetical protein